MGAIQSAIDAKKRERSDERLREGGKDPIRDMREDRPIPDFNDGGEATIYFQRLTPEHIAKHAKDQFSISGRKRMNYIERLKLPSYSFDSVKTLQGAEAWIQAKRLLKNLYKGDTDDLVEMADEALKKGGLVKNKKHLINRI